MAKQAYRETNFRSESLRRIEQIQEILEDYPGQKLTARQVYYQCVARGLLENNVGNYKKLTALLTDARYAGLVDWDVIEDRGRVPETPPEWENIERLVESALRAYRLPRWEGQGAHAEIWCEKQALAGVIAPIAREYHVTLMINKGYSSSSSMKESADRMISACGFDTEEFEDWQRRCNEECGDLDPDGNKYKKMVDGFAKEMMKIARQAIVLYLGDHDPSGEDMVRDIRDRLKEFGVKWLKVEKLGLTMEQIRKFNPPPNPAKLTDSRSKGYIEKYGNESWELDALPPDELLRIIRRALNGIVDKAKMAAIKAREEQDKKLLREAVKGLMGGKDE
jgi:hypothetical protein